MAAINKWFIKNIETNLGLHHLLKYPEKGILRDIIENSYAVYNETSQKYDRVLYYLLSF